MKTIFKISLVFLAMHWAVPVILAQCIDTNRMRELRVKMRDGSLTPREKAELDRAVEALSDIRTPTTKPTSSKLESSKPEMLPKSEFGKPAEAISRDEMRKKRMDEYEVRQKFVFERSRHQQKVALDAAKVRKAPTGPSHEYFVNNEIGDDNASGLSVEKSVKTLAKAVSMLRPGDTLHLAVTGQPYRETLHLGDDFGGVEGKPIAIEAHGATITGSDPLRLDGWVEAGEPGLYKSAKFLSELEEFDDAAKLMRVYFIFDGVMQNMGRSSKGAKSHFKSPQSLQAGEWTYVEAEKTFYLKVNGIVADAKIEAPYRRNGLTIRSPKVAVTHVVIKDLIVCHVLNDGYNLHGTTQNLFLKNIAAYECGDDGISPHETCEVEIDGYWGIGNSTGMANGNLSTTKAMNVQLEGNLAHQFMTGHAPTTVLRNAIIIGSAATPPINVTNSQGTRLTMDNVQISAPKGQRVVNVGNSQIVATRITCEGPTWENAGSVEVINSRIMGEVSNLTGGTWKGDKDGAGADPAGFKIPSRPVPHPAAGKFVTLK